jgi:uncharacterized protein (TIGR00297 family)
MSDRTLVTMMSLMLLVTIPGSLALWLISLISSGLSPTPLRLLTSFVVPLLFAGYGYRRGSVDTSGAIVGYLIAFILTLANAGFSLSLIVFFMLGSRVTKFKAHIKSKIEHDYHKSSRRNWLQALCNCGVAGQLAVVYLIESSVGGELPIDFNYYYTCSWLTIGVVASFACAFGDTLASELGSVMSSGDPFLITTFQRVPRGTNGGVSLVGLIVSALGGFIIGLTYYVSSLIYLNRDTLPLHPSQLPIIWIGLLAGLFGSLIDSLIGATLQYSGVNKRTGIVVETPAPGVERISGFPLLDNHAVNLLSTFIVGIGTPMIASNYFSD